MSLKIAYLAYDEEKKKKSNFCINEMHYVEYQVFFPCMNET